MVKKKHPDDPNSIMGAHEKDHARFRCAFMGAFTENGIKLASEVVQNHITGFLDVLSTMCGEEGGQIIIDLVAWSNFLVFDIAGDLCFGESFGSVPARNAHPCVDMSSRFGRGLAFRASMNPYPGFTALMSLVMPAGMREKMVYHQELSKHKVKQRLESQVDRSDFIIPVLKYNDGKRNPITEAELALNMSVIVFAASETTSIATSAVFNHLLGSPEIFSRLKEELRTAFSSDEDMTAMSMANLEYLTAVMHDTLRLAPLDAVPIPSRIVPKGGAVVCNSVVPGGTSPVFPQLPSNSLTNSRLSSDSANLLPTDRYRISLVRMSFCLSGPSMESHLKETTCRLFIHFSSGAKAVLDKSWLTLRYDSLWQN